MRGDRLSYWAISLSKEYRSHLIRPSYNTLPALHRRATKEYEVVIETTMYIYIYIYIYVCVCVYMCVKHKSVSINNSVCETKIIRQNELKPNQEYL